MEADALTPGLVVKIHPKSRGARGKACVLARVDLLDAERGMALVKPTNHRGLVEVELKWLEAGLLSGLKEE